MPTNVYTSTNPQQTQFEHQSSSGAQQVVVKPLAGSDISFPPLSSLFWVDKRTAVPVANQNGNIELPFARLQSAINACPSDGGSVWVVGQDYTSEGTLTIDGTGTLSFLGTDADALILDTITSDAASYRCERVVATGDLVSGGQLELSLCAISGVVTVGGDLALHGDPSNGDPVSGYIAGVCTIGSSLNAQRWFFGAAVTTQGAITATDCDFGGSLGTGSNATLSGCSHIDLSCVALDEFDCSASGPIIATGDATLRSCQATTLTVTGIATLRNSTFTGNVGVTGSASVFACSLGGNLTVSGALTIDSSSYLTAIRNGKTITAGTLVVTDAVYGIVQKQLAYNPAAGNSNVLVLMPAGHTPGIYSIECSLVVRANATAAGTLTANVTCSGISKTGVNGWTASQFTSGAVPRYPFAPTDSGPRTLNLYSDGSSSITWQIISTGFTGTPSVDLFASCSFSGQG